MRVLITGATGFIGSRLTEALAAAGHTLTALSRSPDSAQQRLSHLEAAFPWIPLDSPPRVKSLAGIDGVVHLAGETVVGRWTARKRAAIRDSRVLGTRHLVDSLENAESRPRVLVAASAIGFYGDRGDEELTEDSPPGSDFLSDVCQQWENEATRAEGLGIRVVRLRIGVVLAPGGGALQAMLPPFKMGVGGPIGSGRQWWSWVHRDDLTGMILWALEEQTAAGVYNATSSEPMRQKEFAKVMGKVIRRPAFIPTPAFAIKLMLGGFSCELLGSKRVLPARLAETGYSYQFAGLEAALRQALSR